MKTLQPVSVGFEFFSGFSSNRMSAALSRCDIPGPGGFVQGLDQQRLAHGFTLHRGESFPHTGSRPRLLRLFYLRNVGFPDFETGGVRLPKPLIQQAGLTDEVDLELRGNTIVIAGRPAPRVRIFTSGISAMT